LLASSPLKTRSIRPTVRAVADLELPFSSRIAFAFAAFFRILFDGTFARRLWSARELPPSSELPAESESIEKSAIREKIEPAIPDSALLLLGLLQREGRLIDFLEQEITTFSDADVGAAARAVHEGARRTLRAHVTLEPVRSEAEGEKITLDSGFDANAIKLTGNVRGAPPHVGTLKHPGWRALELKLPRAVDGHDVHILAPAEVEL
jgi:Domain of unknown function (DUF2760)